MTYEDLQGKDSTFENTPGTEQVIYFAPINDFRYVASPKKFVDVDDYGDATLIGVADDDHLMKQGKKWTRINVLMGTGSIAGETVGDRGSRAVKTNFECVYVGSTKEIQGLQRFSKEDKFIILAPHSDGTVQQIGTLTKPALMTINTSTGKEEEGVKGATITVEASAKGGWVYEGEISTIKAFYFEKALYLSGIPSVKTAFVFNATSDFTFGAWFDFTIGANERAVLLSNTANMEIGVALTDISDGGPVLNTGDVYVYNNSNYYILGNVSLYLGTPFHLFITKLGEDFHITVNGSASSAVTVGIMQFSGWTHLFGTDASSYVEGVVDQLLIGDPISTSNINLIYNDRNGNVPTEIVPSLDYYFSFDTNENGDTSVINQGDLGGVLNIAAGIFVDFDPG